MEQQEEMHRHSRQVYCVICILNQLGDSHLELVELTSEIFNSYGEMSKQLSHIDNSRKSTVILIGKIYASVHYLADNILSKDFSYEAYLSVARNLIEKLALLNHIMKKESRAQALSNLYDISSRDILVMIKSDPSQYDDLISNWLSENGWSTSTVESRVSTLGNKELVLIYAYISRIVHGINRDDLLRRETDEYYISGYVLLLLSVEINRVMAKIPADIYSKNLGNLHTNVAEKIEKAWTQYGGLKVILTLTGFRDEAEGFTKAESEVISDYNKKLEEVIEKGYKFYPKIKLS